MLLLLCVESESGIAANDILVFATGADREPPLGFPLVPTLHFNHDVCRPNNKKYPTANTCALILVLPVLKTYEDFTTVMYEGIVQSPTFGKH